MPEKLEEMKNTVPEKKSTLIENHLEIKNATSAQRNMNKPDHPSSPSSKTVHNTVQPAVGNATSRGRSASPKKLCNSTSKGHNQAPSNSPRKGEPKKTQRDCLEQPETLRSRERKHLATSENADNGKVPAKGKKERSVSPQKHAKRERSRDKLNIEQGLIEFQSRTAAGDKNTAVLLKGENVRLETVKEATTQNISGKDEKCPSETKHSKSPPHSKTNPQDNDLQPANKTKEDGIVKSEARSPVKKTITPGPWKVPSASKVTKGTSSIDKRV